jgi:hypothetical protein
MANLRSKYPPAFIVDLYDLKLMHLIDKKYTQAPFYGSGRMTASLRRDGFRVLETGINK